jgi:hypothetical protein
LAIGSKIEYNLHKGFSITVKIGNGDYLGKARAARRDGFWIGMKITEALINHFDCYELENDPVSSSLGSVEFTMFVQLTHEISGKMVYKVARSRGMPPLRGPRSFRN